MRDAAGCLQPRSGNDASSRGREPADGADDGRVVGRARLQLDVSSSTADPKGIPGNKAVTHLNWDAKAVVTGDDLYNGKPVRWQFSKLEGSYSYDTTEPRAIHCSATLKEKSGYEATNFDLANITYNLGTGEYQVTATAPFDTNALTTGLPQTDPCAEIGASGIPQPGIGDPKAAELGKAITPTSPSARVGHISSITTHRGSRPTRSILRRRSRPT